MLIREPFPGELPEALRLVWNVFTEFEAPEYSTEGTENFKAFIDSREMTGALTFYAAFDGERIIGVAATRGGGNHIALLFVDRRYHRRGIGRQLFESILRCSTSDRITVHASPYAAAVYRRLGFRDTDGEMTENGIRYIPMEYRKPADVAGADQKTAEGAV